jgi:hypothetical protein
MTSIGAEAPVVNEALNNYQHPIASSNPEAVANSVVIRDNE